MKYLKCIIYVLVLFVQHSIGSLHENNCAAEANGFYGKEGLIGCSFEPDFIGVYWYDETNDKEPLIRLESDTTVASGRGYESNEYDILQNGSLVIRNVQSKHEQQYHVILLDSEYTDESFYISFSVIESYCSNQVRGFYEKEGIVSCYFKPGFTGVYWYDDASDKEPLIRLESGIKAGRGYVSNEYDVLQNGSLVIRDVQWTNGQQYRVILLDAEYKDETFDVSFSVINETSPSPSLSLSLSPSPGHSPSPNPSPSPSPSPSRSPNLRPIPSPSTIPIHIPTPIHTHDPSHSHGPSPSLNPRPTPSPSPSTIYINIHTPGPTHDPAPGPGHHHSPSPSPTTKEEERSHTTPENVPVPSVPFTTKSVSTTNAGQIVGIILAVVITIIVLTIALIFITVKLFRKSKQYLPAPTVDDDNNP